MTWTQSRAAFGKKAKRMNWIKRFAIWIGWSCLIATVAVEENWRLAAMLPDWVTASVAWITSQIRDFSSSFTEKKNFRLLVVILLVVIVVELLKIRALLTKKEED